jgi:hypothetical protein
MIWRGRSDRRPALFRENNINFRMVLRRSCSQSNKCNSPTRILGPTNHPTLRHSLSFAESLMTSVFAPPPTEAMHALAIDWSRYTIASHMPDYRLFSEIVSAVISNRPSVQDDSYPSFAMGTLYSLRAPLARYPSFPRFCQCSSNTLPCCRTCHQG